MVSTLLQLLLRAVTLTQQLSYYKEWQSKVVSLVGKDKANAIFSGGIHLISAGSSDFIQNYYINPMLNRAYSPDQFSDILLKSYYTLVQNLYDLGVRRIGVTTLPPTGCLPAAITLFGSGSNQCVSRLNQDAVSFNYKLNNTSRNLKSKLPGLKLVVFDIYNPLLELISKPTDNGQRFCPGFFESRRACCGTGTIETSFLCNARSVGTCSNATQYVFWDGFHPSESANEKLAQSLLEQGFDLIS
ncbi:GDSL esterase/lipase [Forsythia ovata]|uniref:GDSL esterase/lipase n=1 Tax=Forsythia ovata TaxID=205694 RepID=A0ABD1SSL4_9LAMI